MSNVVIRISSKNLVLLTSTPSVPVTERDHVNVRLRLKWLVLKASGLDKEKRWGRNSK